jgi:bifunctional non-homologous end joining protein LigD
MDWNMSASDDALAAYRAKRSPDRTPEPFSGVAAPGGRSFVVHKHAARNMHFDLRLEWNGVLVSFAVPRGPSYDMADKRLAVHVEDHPLEYGEFEGIIPAGNYGAGGVIIWDRGEWTPLEDIREGFEKGKLLFELRGHKLRGKWTLVKIKKGEKEWLLIKERDGYVKSPGDQFNETSVRSGLTVEEVRDGLSVNAKLRATLQAMKGRSLASLGTILDPRNVEVQLAELGKDAFTKDGWIFELKLDGYRILASKVGGEPLLLTRNGNDYTEVFPEVARAIRALPLDDCIVDGEVVVLDAEGKPSFSMLQRRGRLKSAADVRRVAQDLPATFFAFDLLAFEDVDLRDLPLLERKALLRIALPSCGPIRVLDHIEREGIAYLAAVEKMNLEGIIAKKADAPYRGGRSKVWCKIKAEKSDDFVIVGYTAPKNKSGYFGALQLADYVDGDLVYAGRVGTGFSEAFLKETFTALRAIERAAPPCLGPLIDESPAPQIPETKTTTWVEPRLVCEVRYREWTPDGLLRHAAFLRMRDDKNPEECERQGHEGARGREGERTGGIESETAEAGNAEGDPRALPPSRPPALDKSVAISNPKKVYWPDDKFTKGDLIEYYQSISPWLLPYLKNRPVVMTRFPDGIDGKSFYQKDAPDWTPEWVRTVPIWSTDTQREIRYFVADDVETVTLLANLGTIPLHMWLSRVGTLEQPDFCVIDLDPKEAPFSDVIRCAVVLRKLCEDIGMPSYVKTTGKSGLHILLPLGKQCTYEQSRTLGELIARVMLREVDDIATITRHVTRRGDKVYLDYLQNRHGQLIVTPYSVRPLPLAPVSMPLVWDEVNADLDPRNYTIRNAVERMEKLARDPVLPALDEKPDLGAILGKLSQVFAG